MDLILVHNSRETLESLRGELIQQALRRGLHVRALVPASEKSSSPLSFESHSNFSIETISLSRFGLNPFREIFSVLKLGRVLRNLHAENILCTTIKPILYVGLLARLKLIRPKNLSCLVTGLGFALSGEGSKANFVKKIVSSIYRKAFRTYSNVFFQNIHDFQFYQNQKWLSKTQTCMIVGSGVDLSHYFYQPPEHQPLKFVMIARLLKEKGIYEFVEAARVFKNSQTSAEFIIVGPLDSNPSGIKKSEIETWVAEGLVTYKGPLADVRPAIAAASVVVLPSYHEGFSRVLMESLSIGRAIVTTDVPGCREMLVTDVNGFLVPPKNSTALAKALMNFVKNRQLAIDMGISSRRLAEEKFNSEVVNDKILNLLSNQEATENFLDTAAR